MERPLDLTGQEQFINLVTHAPKESTIVWDEGSKPVLVPQNKVIVDEKYKDCLCCASQLVRHKIIDHSVYVKDFSIYKKAKISISKYRRKSQNET